MSVNPMHRKRRAPAHELLSGVVKANLFLPVGTNRQEQLAW